MPTGAAVSYVSGGVHRPLPAPSLAQTKHRPWCAECKKKFDEEELGNAGLCGRFAHAAETRAAAAERRAADPAAEQVWEAAKKAARQPRPEAADEPVKRGRRTRQGEALDPAPQKTDVKPTPVGTPSVRAKVSAVSKSEVVIRLCSTDDQPLDQVAVAALLSDLLTGLRRKTKKRRPAAKKQASPKVREHNGPQRIQLPSPAVEEAYAAGETLAQIAARYGVSSPTIARHLEDHGVQRRQQKAAYTPELLEQIRAAYADEGLNQVQVAERLGLTTKVVQTAMDIAGIESRDSASARSAKGIGRAIKLDAAAQADVLARYQAGEAVSVVAEAHGVSKPSIYYLLDKHGVPRHGARPAGSGHDGAAALKQTLAGLTATSREIKAWGLEQGLVDHIARGMPSRRLVDAYAAAHPDSCVSPDRCTTSPGSPTSASTAPTERTSA